MSGGGWSSLNLIRLYFIFKISTGESAGGTFYVLSHLIRRVYPFDKSMFSYKDSTDRLQFKFHMYLTSIQGWL